MASSLATSVAAQPSSSSSSVRGIAGSSIHGMKLVIKPASQKLRPRSVRSGAVVAKYADKSVCFDLEDIGNTIGQWDSTGGGSTFAYFSATSSGDILPIKKGRQLPSKLGHRGKI